MAPFPIPTINTLLLLSSGATLTVSHHALRMGHRNTTMAWLLATVLLGITFLCLQVFEYHHAYTELNLRLTSGIYGSTFFLLTGFHGFHVTMGALMLTIVLIRLKRGHFTAEHHFAFEAQPGTGTSWTWSGLDCTSSCTGSSELDWPPRSAAVKRRLSFKPVVCGRRSRH